VRKPVWEEATARGARHGIGTREAGGDFEGPGWWVGWLKLETAAFGLEFFVKTVFRYKGSKSGFVWQ